MALTIEREAADSAEMLAMLHTRDFESANLYPSETNFSIPAGEHDRDDVLLYVLREDGTAIGCGAIEKHDGYAEMKSVFLMPVARGRRLGQVIIGKLEEVALELGYDEVRLETGNLSPWAMKSYERAGYSYCDRFGDYPENAYSLFMVKRLPAVGAAAMRRSSEQSTGGNSAMSEQLEDIANRMVAEGRGILAADESTGTIQKRFDSIGTPNTEENRRDYREMLFRSAEAMKNYVSGVILFDETLRQKAKDGTPFVDLINAAGAVPGIKVDAGAKPLPGFPGELVTEGLDGLRERLKEYYGLGARFAKWRAVITIGEDGRPSWNCVHANAHALARYAALCQEARIVPIVEPEVLMDGPDARHTIDRCYDVTVWTLQTVFSELHVARVDLEGIVLKPNMVVPGQKSGTTASVEEVAEKTVRALRATVPPAVPGIAFLSGGQSDDEATAHLSAMNAMYALPWKLTFSYGRALQAAALKAWGGKAANTAAGQAAFAHRARMNSLAATGKWSRDQEKKAA